MMQLMH